MKRVKYGIGSAVVLLLALGLTFTPSIFGDDAAHAASNSVAPPAAVNQVFPDPFLTETICNALTLGPTDIVTQAQLNLLVAFEIHDEHITDISGVEHLRNLRTLDLSENDIANISPLDGVTFPNLQVLSFADQVIDLPIVIWQPSMQLTNTITNMNSTLIAPNTINEGGTYASPTVSWTLSNHVPNLSYTFTTPITINSIQSVFSGTVNQPLEDLYTATFFVDGSVYATREGVRAGDLIQRPNKPEKTGFRFLGWNTQESGGGDMWYFDSGVMPAADLNLYAQWEPIEPAKEGTETIKVVIKTETKTKIKTVTKEVPSSKVSSGAGKNATTGDSGLVILATVALVAGSALAIIVVGNQKRKKRCLRS